MSRDHVENGGDGISSGSMALTQGEQLMEYRREIAKLRKANASEYLRGFRYAREMAAKVATKETDSCSDYYHNECGCVTNIIDGIKAIEPGE